MTLAERLKNERKKSGLSQKELADKLDMNARTYASYERGERDISTAVLLNICKVLEISSDVLLGNTTVSLTPTDLRANTKPVPLIGRVAAGLSCHAEDNIEGYILTDCELLHEGYEYFWLSVKGDSMEPELHSGDRVQLMFNGKSYSFTAASEDEAIYQAVLFKTGRAKEKKHSPKLGECIDKYIETKSNILSPSTLDSYRRIKKNYLSPLEDKDISSITNEDVQSLVNQIALNHSPKTVRNAHGLLASVLNVYAPDLNLRTSLPKPKKHIKELAEPQAIIEAVTGSDVELPVLMALWLGMRLSEIRGAKKQDIKKGVLTIQRTIITVAGEHIEKEQTKTTDSTRRLKLPPRILQLIEALPAEQEYLTTFTHSQIYKKFNALLAAHGLERMPFHDLRHINASVMLALGIPDKYAMERGGWSSTNVMKAVYQSTFSAKREAVDAEIDDYFEALYHTKNHTD